MTITKNGKAIAEIGPPQQKTGGFDWDHAERVRKELGLDKIKDQLGFKLDDKWLDEFNDPAWARELFGSEYYDDETPEK